MATLMKVKDIHKYHINLRHSLDFSTIWHTLQYKTEYGPSEKGYQYNAMYTAGTLARELGCDDDLAEILTMCLGSFFPPYGEAGLECVINYMKEKGLYTTTSDLAINYIENTLEKDGNIITPEFDALLHELFSDNVGTTEIQIARLCQDMIKKIKIIAYNSDKNSHDLLETISDEIKQATKENHALTSSPTLEELYNNLPVINKPSLTAQQYDKFISSLDELSNHGKNIEGIYEYISYGYCYI
ncbi:MAG: hypothetical protein LUG46_06930 [Erysipelotrichaceae bacterium]|nr:hypothetical protein [Erysipelotrichaceae bacterium]